MRSRLAVRRPLLSKKFDLNRSRPIALAVALHKAADTLTRGDMVNAGTTEDIFVKENIGTAVIIGHKAELVDAGVKKLHATGADRGFCHWFDHEVSQGRR
jgi:hypothetical protein